MNKQAFSQSQKLLQRALKTIPLGAQTFSKSHIQYPKTSSPFFVTHGQGAHVWDVDGNEFIDLVGGLLPNILGYCDPDVNQAIADQLKKGISFSLGTELEVALAERLCALIPSAEMVRFGKNGTDVTSAAVRLARAHTRRDRVILCGYHGWQDWSIGVTTRNKGVPSAVSELTDSVPYNDLDRVETLLKTENYACVILEPFNLIKPPAGYLSGLKTLCEQFGTLLVFDEIITGFRFDIGGAQKLFNVTPDLSCFGKSMGNGMPISAIVGKREIMMGMEDIFFSGTFGGESLSIAAALATIQKIQDADVIPYLWRYGDDLSERITQLIIRQNLEHVISMAGFGPWPIVTFSETGDSESCRNTLRTLFQQEMIGQGILIQLANNLSFALDEDDKRKILAAYDHTLSVIREFIDAGDKARFLKNPTIIPVFQVR